VQRFETVVNEVVTTVIVMHHKNAQRTGKVPEQIMSKHESRRLHIDFGIQCFAVSAAGWPPVVGQRPGTRRGNQAAQWSLAVGGLPVPGAIPAGIVFDIGDSPYPEVLRDRCRTHSCSWPDAVAGKPTQLEASPAFGDPQCVALTGRPWSKPGLQQGLVIAFFVPAAVEPIATEPQRSAIGLSVLASSH
jgi:hypothetical protein